MIHNRNCPCPVDTADRWLYTAGALVVLFAALYLLAHVAVVGR